MPGFALAVPLLLLQTAVARPVTDVPLEKGRWVVRDTREVGTGKGGVSASLQSRDGRYRLVVRCDYSYDYTLSLQLLPVLASVPKPVSKGRLFWQGEKKPIGLTWEAAGPGMFARDSVSSGEATAAAHGLQSRPGVLRFTASTDSGRMTAEFDSDRDRAAISLILGACNA